MARRYPYDTSSDALLSPAKNAVFFEDWTPGVDDVNDDLLCAEMSRLAYAEQPVVVASLAKIGFEPLGFFGDDSLAMRVATRGTEGFVATNRRRGVTVVAFRGTEADHLEDIFSDLDTWQTEHARGGRVHRGFHQAYIAVRERISMLLQSREPTLLLTGHSLGAALATLAAVDFAPTALITFGSPRVGDAGFCAHLESFAAAGSVRRFVDCCDVVARLPPERFGRGELSELMRDLGMPELAADALARGIAALALSAVFQHVAPPRYIRFDGTIVEAPDAETQRRDQEAARRAYPHSARTNFAQVTEVLSALGRSPGKREIMRQFGRSLFGFVRGDPVPLRDLADHAPINYLSGITGRAP